MGFCLAVGFERPADIANSVLCELTGSRSYSLVIPEGGSFTITKADKIAIQDNENHWHRLSIESLQIDRVDHEEVRNGKVGIKVDRLVSGARDYYVVKA